MQTVNTLFPPAALHQCPPHLKALQLLPDDQSGPRSSDCNGLICDVKSRRDNMSFRVFAQTCGDQSRSGARCH